MDRAAVVLRRCGRVGVRKQNQEGEPGPGAGGKAWMIKALPSAAGWMMVVPLPGMGSRGGNGFWGWVDMIKNPVLDLLTLRCL